MSRISGPSSVGIAKAIGLVPRIGLIPPSGATAPPLLAVWIATKPSRAIISTK